MIYLEDQKCFLHRYIDDVLLSTGFVTESNGDDTQSLLSAKILQLE